jgi:hypothetical protein
MRKLLIMLTVTLWIAASIAHAQMRPLPADGKRATVGQPQALPYVELGGKLLRLAPGGTIYDQNNRSIVHGALPAGADVVYANDMNGDVARIYILTPQEQAQLNRQR